MGVAPGMRRRGDRVARGAAPEHLRGLQHGGDRDELGKPEEGACGDRRGLPRGGCRTRASDRRAARALAVPRAGGSRDDDLHEAFRSSLDKFDSSTGWPSFTRPLEPANVTTRTDHLLFYARTEVRSKLAGSHLGHVFDDGPPPTGLRYCMNSAALRFVPIERLAEEGYGRFLPLFERSAGNSPDRGGGASP